jgi:hypothetical protein
LEKDMGVKTSTVQAGHNVRKYNFNLWLTLVYDGFLKVTIENNLKESCKSEYKHASDLWSSDNIVVWLRDYFLNKYMVHYQSPPIDSLNFKTVAASFKYKVYNAKSDLTWEDDNAAIVRYNNKSKIIKLSNFQKYFHSYPSHKVENKAKFAIGGVADSDSVNTVMSKMKLSFLEKHLAP